MKKTLALVGVGALGLAAGGAGALPAMADATEPCVDLSDHSVTADAGPSNWYMDCVPQYGLGKAEFTIVPNLDDPAEEFPAGFADLRDIPPVEYSTTMDLDAINEYFGGFPSVFPAPIAPVELFDSTPVSQTWGALVLAPVTGVEAATPLNVPDDVADLCGLDGTPYGGGWVATFGAVDTTYSQVVDGEEWTYEVSGTPLPVFYFGTIIDDGGTMSISDSDPWCVSDGFGAITDATGAPVDILFGLVYHGLPADLEEEAFDLPSYGTFGRFEASAPAAVPTLAATGAEVDPLAPMIAGGFLALLGTAFVGLAGLVRRRKQA